MVILSFSDKSYIYSIPMRLRSQGRKSEMVLRSDDKFTLPKTFQDRFLDEDDDEDEDEDSDYVESSDEEKDHNYEDLGIESEYHYDELNECIQDRGSNDVPELDLNELIILANQIVRNSPPSVSVPGSMDNGSANVQIRFPLIRSVSEARDIILQYERLNSGAPSNIGNSNITWESITQDENGISITGTRSVTAPYDRIRQTVNPSDNLPTTEESGVHSHRQQPLWLELTGLATVTMFLFTVYRMVANLVAISAFTDNVFTDVVEFVDLVNSNEMLPSNTLVLKFAAVLKHEMPYLPDTIWIAFTVLCFSIYTIFTSGIVLTSILFATMCFTMCVLIRWRYVGDFMMRLLHSEYASCIW